MEFILLISLLCLKGITAAPTEHTGQSVGPRCYDCNYAPAGFIKASAPAWNRGAGQKEVGFSSCALRNSIDYKRVDQWVCHTGMCYIRKDDNGLIYRGCANPEYLPKDVKYGANCKYQGANKSLWWFCKGDLCNDGQIGEDVDHCGSPPPPRGYGGSRSVGRIEPRQGPTQGAAMVPSVSRGDGRTTMYAVVAAPRQQSQSHSSNPPMSRSDLQALFSRVNQHSGYHVPRTQGSRGTLVGYYDFTGQDFGQVHTPQRTDPVSHSHTMYTVVQPQAHNTHTYTHRQQEIQYSRPQPASVPTYSRHNPCDGDCKTNPTGLYADPSRHDQFIQCSAGSRGGESCLCCAARYMKCPAGTQFDSVTKVCTS